MDSDERLAHLEDQIREIIRKQDALNKDMTLALRGIMHEIWGRLPMQIRAEPLGLDDAQSAVRVAKQATGEE